MEFGYWFITVNPNVNLSSKECHKPTYIQLGDYLVYDVRKDIAAIFGMISFSMFYL